MNRRAIGRADWEKNTDNNLNQILWCRREASSLMMMGRRRGRPNTRLSFTNRRPTSHCRKKRTVAITRENGEPEWYGLAELKEGLL